MSIVVSASNLVSSSAGGVSPVVALFAVSSDAGGKPKLVGRTEWIRNDSNPAFSTALSVPSGAAAAGSYRFTVYSPLAPVINPARDEIGTATVSAQQLAAGGVFPLTSRNAGTAKLLAQHQSTITIAKAPAAATAAAPEPAAASEVDSKSDSKADAAPVSVEAPKSALVYDSKVNAVAVSAVAVAKAAVAAAVDSVSVDFTLEARGLPVGTSLVAFFLWSAAANKYVLVDRTELGASNPAGADAVTTFSKSFTLAGSSSASQTVRFVAYAPKGSFLHTRDELGAITLPLSRFLAAFPAAAAPGSSGADAELPLQLLKSGAAAGGLTIRGRRTVPIEHVLSRLTHGSVVRVSPPLVTSSTFVTVCYREDDIPAPYRDPNTGQLVVSAAAAIADEEDSDADDDLDDDKETASEKALHAGKEPVLYIIEDQKIPTKYVPPGVTTRAEPEEKHTSTALVNENGRVLKIQKLKLHNIIRVIIRRPKVEAPASPTAADTKLDAPLSPRSPRALGAETFAISIIFSHHTNRPITFECSSDAERAMWIRGLSHLLAERCGKHDIVFKEAAPRQTPASPTAATSTDAAAAPASTASTVAGDSKGDSKGDEKADAAPAHDEQAADEHLDSAGFHSVDAHISCQNLYGAADNRFGVIAAVFEQPQHATLSSYHPFTSIGHSEYVYHDIHPSFGRTFVLKHSGPAGSQPHRYRIAVYAPTSGSTAMMLRRRDEIGAAEFVFDSKVVAQLPTGDEPTRVTFPLVFKSAAAGIGSQEVGTLTIQFNPKSKLLTAAESLPAPAAASADTKSDAPATAVPVPVDGMDSKHPPKAASDAASGDVKVVWDLTAPAAAAKSVDPSHPRTFAFVSAAPSVSAAASEASVGPVKLHVHIACKNLISLLSDKPEAEAVDTIVTLSTRDNDATEWTIVDQTEWTRADASPVYSRPLRFTHDATTTLGADGQTSHGRRIRLSVYQTTNGPFLSVGRNLIGSIDIDAHQLFVSRKRYASEEERRAAVAEWHDQHEDEHLSLAPHAHHHTHKKWFVYSLSAKDDRIASRLRQADSTLVLWTAEARQTNKASAQSAVVAGKDARDLVERSERTALEIARAQQQTRAERAELTVREQYARLLTAQSELASMQTLLKLVQSDKLSGALDTATALSLIDAQLKIQNRTAAVYTPAPAAAAPAKSSGDQKSAPASAAVDVSRYESQLSSVEAQRKALESHISTQEKRYAHLLKDKTAVDATVAGLVSGRDAAVAAANSAKHELSEATKTRDAAIRDANAARDAAIADANRTRDTAIADARRKGDESIAAAAAAHATALAAAHAERDSFKREHDAIALKYESAPTEKRELEQRLELVINSATAERQKAYEQRAADKYAYDQIHGELQNANKQIAELKARLATPASPPAAAVAAPTTPAVGSPLPAIDSPLVMELKMEKTSLTSKIDHMRQELEYLRKSQIELQEKNDSLSQRLGIASPVKSAKAGQSSSIDPASPSPAVDVAAVMASASASDRSDGAAAAANGDSGADDALFEAGELNDIINEASGGDASGGAAGGAGGDAEDGDDKHDPEDEDDSKLSADELKVRTERRDALKRAFVHYSDAIKADEKEQLTQSDLRATPAATAATPATDAHAALIAEQRRKLRAVGPHSKEAKAALIAKLKTANASDFHAMLRFFNSHANGGAAAATKSTATPPSASSIAVSVMSPDATAAAAPTPASTPATAVDGKVVTIGSGAQRASVLLRATKKRTLRKDFFQKMSTATPKDLRAIIGFFDQNKTPAEATAAAAATPAATPAATDAASPAPTN